MSIDGLGAEFEYLRWPGKWSEATAVIEYIKNMQLDCEVYTMAGVTFSIMNAWSADQTMQWIANNIGSSYINMVNSPDYLAMHIAPDTVKQAMLDRIANHEVRGYLTLKEYNPQLWKQFIIWMKRQDLYRNQSFASTFPEFFQIIQPWWDSITNLSEQNFYA